METIGYQVYNEVDSIGQKKAGSRQIYMEDQNSTNEEEQDITAGMRMGRRREDGRNKSK